MPQKSTFIQEGLAAGRGVVALLVGNRQASGFFDFSRRGLIGSYIAVLAIVALGAALPLILRMDHDSIAGEVVQLVVIYGFQVGFVSIVLRQIGRMDALTPYLVSYNWLNFFATLILAVLLAMRITGDLLLLAAVGLAALVIVVNVARIVMALSPLQIAMLLIAQTIGVGLAALLLTLIFPLPPEIAAQLGSAG